MSVAIWDAWTIFKECEEVEGMTEKVERGDDEPGGLSKKMLTVRFDSTGRGG